MIAKDSFIILQSGTELTGALCRVGLKSRDVSYLHHVTCADLTPQAVASGLRSLLDGLAAAGLKRPDDVRVCLSAGAALFRDWAFPFRSRAKVEQALSLMLETEFPFDADTLSHRVCLTGNAAASAGYKSGVQAISVSLRKEERDSWLDAFEAEGLFPRLVTVDPFPLLMNLPSRQNGMALLLYVERGCSTLALLDNGVIRRIRTIPVGWPPETDAADLNVSLSERENAALRGFADRLRRETSLVLDGTPFVPDRLLAYGEAFLGNGASARFAEAFELPVSVLGQEVPLAGQVARLGETDPSRLLALCVAAMPLPAPWRPPLFPSFHRPPKGGHLSSEHGRRLAWAACGALAVGAACLASVWAEGYAAGQQAVRHEAAARSLFRKALPDVRGSFNPVQMESILKNRIAGLRGGGENDATFPALHLLQDMHAAVPDSLDIRLDRLSLDARRCGLSGTAASYEQVNALRVALSGLPGVREAKILSAASRTGKPEPGTPSGAVIFEIELALEGGQS